jgi:hypothetical protein
VRVTSAPAPVERGALVRISGWVRVTSEASDRPVIRIFDSLGGEALADYRGVSGEWRPFVLYRAGLHPGQLTVTFELLEPGDVWIDAVRVESLSLAAASASGLGPPPHQGAQGLSAGKAETFAH